MNAKRIFWTRHDLAIKDNFRVREKWWQTTQHITLQYCIQ